MQGVHQLVDTSNPLFCIDKAYNQGVMRIFLLEIVAASKDPISTTVLRSSKVKRFTIACIQDVFLVEAKHTISSAAGLTKRQCKYELVHSLTYIF